MLVLEDPLERVRGSTLCKRKAGADIKAPSASEFPVCCTKKIAGLGHAPSFMLPTSLVMLDGPALIVGTNAGGKSYDGVSRIFGLTLCRSRNDEK